MIDEIEDDDTQHLFITPSTMFLPADGLRIAAIGADSEWIDKLGDDMEHAFPAIPMTFYHLDDTTREQWEWQYMMTSHCNLVMVNLANATVLDLITALRYIGENKLWIYTDPEKVDKNIIALLNTIDANIFFSSEQMISMLRAYVGE